MYKCKVVTHAVSGQFSACPCHTFPCLLRVNKLCYTVGCLTAGGKLQDTADVCNIQNIWAQQFSISWTNHCKLLPSLTENTKFWLILWLFHLQYNQNLHKHCMCSQFSFMGLNILMHLTTIWRDRKYIKEEQVIMLYKGSQLEWSWEQCGCTVDHTTARTSCHPNSVRFIFSCLQMLCCFSLAVSTVFNSYVHSSLSET